MEQRELGRSGIKVSALGLGLMSMSGVYGNANDEESIGVIHYALDKGINFLDSADMYGWGHNETLLGKALKGRRDKVVVATKFGRVKLADGKQAVDGRPGYVMQACEASLKRLGIEVIDLYYQHRVDTNTPIEDTVGAMKQLVEQGKVRALGLSEARPETIRRAHKVHAIAAVQNEYSLLYRQEGEETLQATRALARQCQQGALTADDIDERALQAELALSGLPDPDLFVRTGGERRISNFLLWNLAYTELYFCDVLWPDFTRSDLEAAFDFFAHRQRRFGMTPAQVSAR